MNSARPPDRELLAELLLRWEELYERGRDTPASELAKDHPELIPELARRIKALKTVSWITKPIPEPPSSQNDTASVSATGRTLGGRYRLEELVAEGGFAEVYRAYDTELQRIVAVKIPKPSRLGSADSFLAEARRVAKLKHDRILPVYDVGVEEGLCFIVSEYLEGGSLADRIKLGKASREEALRWIGEIADALQYAHLHGIVHRDVKPSNILVDHHGRAKLADFGIALSSMKTGEFAPSLGTLRYMSPEVLGGKPADHRSDIYSLGLVLYEALTGTLPFSSLEPSILRREIVQGGLRWAKDFPPDLKAVCQKALSVSPHRRQGSVAEFASELKRATSYRKGTLVLGTVGAIGVLSAMLLGGWGIGPKAKPRFGGQTAVTATSSPTLPASIPPVPKPRIELKRVGDFEYRVGPDGAIVTRYLGSDSSVTVPESVDGKPVVGIEEFVFRERTDLKTVALPPTLLAISRFGFYGCTGLQRITVPPHVKAIGMNAFQFCSSLGEIYLPASISQIGPMCFVECGSLKTISVDETNEHFTSVDGILYDKQVTKLIVCPAGKRGELKIPPSVKTVCELSFLGCDKLRRIVIPDSVTELQNQAFHGCSAAREVLGAFEFDLSVEGLSLTRYFGRDTSVVIPEKIGGREVVMLAGCFKDQGKITAVSIPKTVRGISPMTFHDCSRLTGVVLPDALTHIGYQAFEGCSSLGDIAIPASVEKIGGGCFNNCSSMKAITVAEANLDYASVDGILYDKEMTTLLNCPAGKQGEVKIPPTVTTIVGWSFSGCDKLTRIAIPESVTDMQPQAFVGCNATRDVVTK